MLGRIVEIAKDHRHLSLYRGFMCIEDTSQPHDQPARKLGRIPLADITAVIAHAHGITYTNNLLVALAEQGTPFILCSANHNVVGLLMATISKRSALTRKLQQPNLPISACGQTSSKLKFYSKQLS